MTIKHSLAAVLFALAANLIAPGTAHAGRGGSNELIVAAVQSGSVDSIIAELEQTEGLMCDACIQTVTNLTEDSRYRVREVAGWWFARRPQMADALAEQFVGDLGSSDSIRVRNAADFLGAIRDYKALPALQASMRGALKPEAKLAIVRAVGFMAHVKGNPTLLAAMGDSDAGVRAAAVVAWRDVLGQTSVEAVMPLLRDSSAEVRSKTATLAGAYAARSARPQLEELVAHDSDPTVRRNAAWALGKIGDVASSKALAAATSDPSSIVRGVAKAALASLGQRK
jgi:HEAT repeat protein